MHAPRSYALICPCRDEAKFVRHTLDSVLAQSIKPAVFLIVDDGSTDGTPAILAQYAAQHPGLIQIVTRTNRGARAVGAGVIEAFYEGYRALQTRIDAGEFQYLCKLDLDLILPEQYFESLLVKMEEDPRLGTCSGKAYKPIDPTNLQGAYESELLGDENSGGFCKFYRVACFKQIGGFVRQVMWDGIDGHRARMFGWKTGSWDGPTLMVKHLRPMGSSHKGIYTGRMRHGFGQWFMGTGIIYMAASAVFRMKTKPYVLGGLAMFYGYLKSMATGVPRLNDPAFREFVRSWQWASLFKGKVRATNQVMEHQAPAWKLDRTPLPMPVEC